MIKEILMAGCIKTSYSKKMSEEYTVTNTKSLRIESARFFKKLNSKLHKDLILKILLVQQAKKVVKLLL